MRSMHTYDDAKDLHWLAHERAAIHCHHVGALAGLLAGILSSPSVPPRTILGPLLAVRGTVVQEVIIRGADTKIHAIILL